MNIKLISHFMPWEIDYALIQFQKLNFSRFYLNSNDNIYIDTALCLSDKIINWSKSKIQKDFFIEKYNTISKLLNSFHHNQTIYQGSEIYGHLDLQRNSVQSNIDVYIHICPDMYFSETLLFYLIESSKLIKDDYFVITPEIFKMWDSSWDCITNKTFINLPYNALDTENIFSLYKQKISSNDVKIKKLNTYKWAGWFDLYNKGFFEKLFPISSNWHGYGCWDFYTLNVSNLLKNNNCNISVNQYLLENEVIGEYTMGDFRFSGLTSYYKSQIYINDIKNIISSVSDNIKSEIYPRFNYIKNL